MHPVDWFIIALYLGWIIWTGVQHTRGSKEIEGYFLGNRSNPWWAVGLSVMATQLSAITMVGTTGQGYIDGLRFVQFYFGLPLAMVILSVTAVPFFHRARVYTAYEYLERRFDVKTRTLTSALFLLSRGLSCGTIISAPAVILSIIMGWNLTLTVLLIGIPTAIYTMLGGVQAVTWTDVKQMYIIVFGLVAVAIALVLGLPGDVSVRRCPARRRRHRPHAGLRLPLHAERDLHVLVGPDRRPVPDAVVLRLRPEPGAALSHRPLRSRRPRRRSYMSAYWKIPLQVLVLMIGVLVFVFYLFNEPPMLFNPVHEARVKQSALAGRYADAEQRFSTGVRESPRSPPARWPPPTRRRRVRSAETTFLESDAALRAVRKDATALVQDVTGDRTYRDVNYVFPTFVTTHLPIGLIGIVLAAIMAAAMSSIAAELNALATTTVIDFYRRLVRPMRRTRTTSPCRASPPASGASSPASSRCLRPTSARSSRWSIGSGPSSTARSSACSCWPC